MYEADKLKNLNDLELMIFEYMISNKKILHKLTMGDIATQVHVSNAMITRVCQKLGYSGFLEFKAAIRYNISKKKHEDVIFDHQLYIDFFQRMNTEEVQAKIEKIAKKICESRLLIVVGVGLSASLSDYAARLFAQARIRVISNTDYSTPTKGLYNNDDIALFITVSGETREINDQMMNLLEDGVEIVTITNSHSSTSSKLANDTLAYYVPNSINSSFNNSATQVPVIYMLERLYLEIQKYQVSLD